MISVSWQRESRSPNLSGIFDLTILNQVLKENGLKAVDGEGSAQSSSGGNFGAAQ